MPKSKPQLSAIGRLRKYIGFPERKALIDTFVFLDFNCSPLFWQFTSIQKRVLRLLYNDYISNHDSLLAKINKSSMEIKR